MGCHIVFFLINYNHILFR